MASSSPMMAAAMCLFISPPWSGRGLKDLTEGQRITFEVEPDKKGKGPKAVAIW